MHSANLLKFNTRWTQYSMAASQFDWHTSEPLDERWIDDGSACRTSNEPVHKAIYSVPIFKSPKYTRAHQWASARTGIKAKEHQGPATKGVLRVARHREFLAHYCEGAIPDLQTAIFDLLVRVPFHGRTLLIRSWQSRRSRVLSQLHPFASSHDDLLSLV